MEARSDHHQPLLLTEYSLASFLREVGDLSTLAHAACDPDDSSSSKPPRTKRQKKRSTRASTAAVVSRNTKAEHDGRVNALNEKIYALYQELQRLHHIDPVPPPSTSGKWKRRAATERFARTRAQYENESLRQRVVEGVAFQEQVKTLLRRLELQSTMSSRVEFPRIDDDARAFRVLKSDLLKHQVDIESSMQSRQSDIARRSLLPPHAQAGNNWAIAVTRQVMHMCVEQLDVLPFNAGLMNAAVYESTQKGSVPVEGNKIVDKVARDLSTNHKTLRPALERVSGGRELECRTISRRIQHEHGMLYVWESEASWHRSDAVDFNPRAVVRESGWLVMFPSPQDPEHLSIAYCAKAFRIESLNGPRMKRNDPLLRKIVHTCQEVHHFHAKGVESTVIDSSRQQS